jgi:hypothetical protein
VKIRDVNTYQLEAALVEPFAYSQAWYVEAQLNALSELRELPSGSLRLTAGRHAVETVLWPAGFPAAKCWCCLRMRSSACLPWSLGSRFT